MSDLNYPSRRRKPDNAKPTTRDVNVASRVQMALRLRAQRYTFEEIARRCGYGSRGAAHHAVMRELDRVVTRDVEQMRTEELYSLDQMEVECQEMFMDKKNKGRLFAADRILSIKERRAKLGGLDARHDEIAGGATIIREYGVEVNKV